MSSLTGHSPYIRQRKLVSVHAITISVGEGVSSKITPAHLPGAVRGVSSKITPAHLPGAVRGMSSKITPSSDTFGLWSNVGRNEMKDG